jgi:hypothetical protein
MAATQQGRQQQLLPQVLQGHWTPVTVVAQNRHPLQQQL